MAQPSPMLKSSAKKIPITPEAAGPGPGRACHGISQRQPARLVFVWPQRAHLTTFASWAHRRAERTQFRGPNVAGIAQGYSLPVTWSNSDTHTVLWRAAVPGLGHSSPIIWADRVFVATAVGNPEEHH